MFLLTVSTLISLGLGLGKVRVLSQVLGLQLGLKGLIRGLGVDGLLLKDGEDSHWILKQLEAGSEVHAKVAGHPNNSLPHVFLLLQHEHSVVEELLQFFVYQVDTDLFKSVELKDLKTGNIEYTNKVDFLHCRVNEGGVTHVNNVSEETTVNILDDRSSTHFTGVHVLGLAHPLGTNLEKEYFLQKSF